MDKCHAENWLLFATGVLSEPPGTRTEVANNFLFLQGVIKSERRQLGTHLRDMNELPIGLIGSDFVELFPHCRCTMVQEQIQN
jgi:hypothetical protein